MKRFLDQKQEEEFKLSTNRHQGKLEKLGLNIGQYNQTTTKIHNLSNRELSSLEKSLLTKGLNHCIFPFRINLLDIQTEFESLYHELRPGVNITQRCEFRRVLFSLYSKYKSNYFYEKNDDPAALDNDERLALKKLKAEDSIVICKPDKGQEIVILDKDDYLAKLEALPADRFVFKPAEENDNIQNLVKFQNFYTVSKEEKA